MRVLPFVSGGREEEKRKGEEGWEDDAMGERERGEQGEGQDQGKEEGEVQDEDDKQSLESVVRGGIGAVGELLAFATPVNEDETETKTEGVGVVGGEMEMSGVMVEEGAVVRR